MKEKILLKNFYFKLLHVIKKSEIKKKKLLAKFSIIILISKT